LGTLEYTFRVVPIGDYPKYLKKYKRALTDEVLDAFIIFYYLKNKTVYSKIIDNSLDIPVYILFSADLFSVSVHREILRNFPSEKPNKRK
jgi:hypothetical protein